MQKILTCLGWSLEGLLWDHLRQTAYKKLIVRLNCEEHQLLLEMNLFLQHHKHSHTNYGPYVFFHGAQVVRKMHYAPYLITVSGTKRWKEWKERSFGQDGETCSASARTILLINNKVMNKNRLSKYKYK
jgi:hypothetical protein